MHNIIVETEVVITTTYHFKVETIDRVEIQQLIATAEDDPFNGHRHVAPAKITHIEDDNEEYPETGFNDG